MAHWLDALKVVVCAGTGGVGKTTMAAVLALHEAQRGRNVLVLTIDPARRLADALGIQIGAEEKKVSLPSLKAGSLSAAMIDPQLIFTEFVRRHSRDPEVGERLLRNRLFKELSSTLSGSQEFTSLERLLSAVESKKYDLIVLDTPPTQHAIDFLRAPERIFSLFQDSVTNWFIEPKENAGLLQNLFNRGSQAVLSAFERITGRGFLTELSEFFLSAVAIQATVAQRSIAVHRLMNQVDTGFVLVTAFDEAKMKEAIEFASDLSRGGHQLKAVIINRALPFWLSDSTTKLVTSDETLQRLVSLRDTMSEYYHERQRSYEQMIERFHHQMVVMRVPEEKQSLEGLSGLLRLTEYLKGDT